MLPIRSSINKLIVIGDASFIYTNVEVDDGGFLVETKYHTAVVHLIPFPTLDAFIAWRKKTDNRKDLLHAFCLHHSSSDDRDIDLNLLGSALGLSHFDSIIIACYKNKLGEARFSALTQWAVNYGGAEIVDLRPSREDIEVAEEERSACGFNRILEILGTTSWTEFKMKEPGRKGDAIALIREQGLNFDVHDAAAKRAPAAPSSSKAPAVPPTGAEGKFVVQFDEDTEGLYDPIDFGGDKMPAFNPHMSNDPLIKALVDDFSDLDSCGIDWDNIFNAEDLKSIENFMTTETIFDLHERCHGLKMKCPDKERCEVEIADKRARTKAKKAKARQKKDADAEGSKTVARGDSGDLSDDVEVEIDSSSVAPKDAVVGGPPPSAFDPIVCESLYDNICREVKLHMGDRNDEEAHEIFQELGKLKEVIEMLPADSEQEMADQVTSKVLKDILRIRKHEK